LRHAACRSWCEPAVLCASPVNAPAPSTHAAYQ
jgi:hypothetical protein